MAYICNIIGGGVACYKTCVWRGGVVTCGCLCGVCVWWVCSVYVYMSVIGVSYINVSMNALAASNNKHFLLFDFVREPGTSNIRWTPGPRTKFVECTLRAGEKTVTNLQFVVSKLTKFW